MSSTPEEPTGDSVAWVCYGPSSDEKHSVDYQQDDIDALPVGTLLYPHPPAKLRLVAWQWKTTMNFRKTPPPNAEPGVWRPVYTEDA